MMSEKKNEEHVIHIGQKFLTTQTEYLEPDALDWEKKQTHYLI